MNDIRAGGLTTRLHTISTVRAQNVAAHSWGVAMLARDIYRRAGRDIPANVLVACLVHDIPEGRVGDVPSPVKWANPVLAKALVIAEENEAHRLEIDREMSTLTEVEQDLVEFCDKLELLWHCVDEARLGNQHIARVFHNQISWFTTPAGQKLLVGHWFVEEAERMINEIDFFFHNPALKEIPGK